MLSIKVLGIAVESGRQSPSCGLIGYSSVTDGDRLVAGDRRVEVIKRHVTSLVVRHAIDGHEVVAGTLARA